MTDNVINLASRQSPDGSWIATVHVWRRPDGTVSLQLADMPAKVIEQMQVGEDAVRDRVLILAGWIEEGAARLRAEADLFSHGGDA